MIQGLWSKLCVVGNSFNVLLTVYHAMILGSYSTSRTNSFNVFIYL